MTPRGVEVLKGIRNYITEKGCSPSISQLGTLLGVGRVTAFRHIMRLEAEGLLKRTPGRRRSVVPVDPRPEGPLDAVYGQGMLVVAMELEAALVGNLDVERVQRMARLTRQYAMGWINETVVRAGFAPCAP